MCVCQLQLQSRLPVTTVLSQTALWRPHEVGWLHGAIASSGFQGRSCVMLLLVSEPKIQISLISQVSLLYWHPKFYYHVSWINMDSLDSSWCSCFGTQHDPHCWSIWAPCLGDTYGYLQTSLWIQHLYKHVRPNPDVAQHLQTSWSSSSSPSSHHHHHIIIITLKFATRSEPYADWGNSINFILRGQNSPPPLKHMLTGVITSTLSSWGVQNSPPPLNHMLTGLKPSTLSSWGVKICHPLWTMCWLG